MARYKTWVWILRDVSGEDDNDAPAVFVGWSQSEKSALKKGFQYLWNSCADKAKIRVLNGCVVVSDSLWFRQRHRALQERGENRNHVYKGRNGHEVTVNAQPLEHEPSCSVWNHSPAGFSWGYCGSGPAQLALAILLHEGLEEDEACDLHQKFKFDVVAKLESEWSMQSTRVWQWVIREKERRAREAMSARLFD